MELEFESQDPRSFQPGQALRGMQRRVRAQDHVARVVVPGSA